MRTIKLHHPTGHPYWDADEFKIEMQNLSNFLNKFRKLKNPIEERVLIAKIVSDILGVSVSDEFVLVKNSTLYIKQVGKIKSEIFMKKNLILEELKKQLPKLNIQEIS